MEYYENYLVLDSFLTFKKIKKNYILLQLFSTFFSILKQLEKKILKIILKVFALKIPFLSYLLNSFFNFSNFNYK